MNTTNAANAYMRQIAAEFQGKAFPPEKLAQLRAESKAAHTELVRESMKHREPMKIWLRDELRGGLEPRKGGALRRLNPAIPPAKPPITAVAFANDDQGRRFKITTIFEELEAC